MAFSPRVREWGRLLVPPVSASGVRILTYVEVTKLLTPTFAERYT